MLSLRLGIQLLIKLVNRLLCKAKTIGALVSLCPVKGTFDKLFSEVMSARILFTCSFSMLSLCFANC